MESSEIVDPRQPRTTKVKAKASTDASPASDQRSGNGAPRSDSGRGPWIRRSASAISASLILASPRRMRPSAVNSHSSFHCRSSGTIAPSHRGTRTETERRCDRRRSSVSRRGPHARARGYSRRPRPPTFWRAVSSVKGGNGGRVSTNPPVLDKHGRQSRCHGLRRPRRLGNAGIAAVTPCG